VQLPLTSLADDVAATRRTLAHQEGPTVLVGHSYGGAVITAAGTDAQVTALVYVAAYAPDQGEALGDINKPAPGQQQIRPGPDGFLWLDTQGFQAAFAQDVAVPEARLMAAVQKPIQSKIFGEKMPQAAWKSKASWFQISENDQMVPPELQQTMAQRIGATVVSLAASHASMVSRPADVAAVILKAASR
jgi:pimeloyl-ACP methyl ester carboxylesterase